MMTKDDIRARLAELQAEAAKSSAVTLESIIAELTDAATVARSRGQAQALVSAAMSKAKLAGLMVERVEVGNPGDFDNLTSTAAIVDRTLELLVEQFVPIDEKDRQGLIALHERWLQETEDYVNAIKARPVIAERVDARNLSKPWQDHEPFAPKSPRQRIGYNGSKGRET